MKSLLYGYVILVLTLTACSSGKSTFERGNYYEAVITAVNRLRRNSDHKKSVETLRQAYPMAVTFYEDQANTALSSAERFKWTAVVRSYTVINSMYDEIKRCPGALAVIPNPVNYFDKLQLARQNAAEENYSAGILALQTGTRENAKQAYGYFKITNDHIPGYKDVHDYLQASLSAATVKIVVEPIPVHSKSVGVSAEFFNDKISEFIHSASISQFVKFYTRAEAQKTKLNPDHILQLEFDDLTVGQVLKHEKELQLSRDSVVLGSYATNSGPANQDASTNAQRTGTGSGLVATGKNPVLASSKKPVNATSNSNSAGNPTTVSTSENAEALAERQRKEQELREKELAEKAMAEREAAERERLAKQAAEKQKADEEAAQKQRAAEAAAQAEKAAKEAAAKAQADKLAAEKDQSEKERLERERAERERIERENAERERAAREKAEKELAEKLKAEKEQAEKELAAKAQAERDRAEKEKADRVREANERAVKEQADRQRAEKEKAELDKANKERTEKGNAQNEKYVDSSIKSEDTLNLIDPVVVCHIPPGNNTNARTLRINRAALKAHLAHGDIEGGCEEDNEGQKNKQDAEEKGEPDAQPKGKPAEEPKGKPLDDKKGKGGKGTGSLNDRHEAHYALLLTDPILFASRENNPSEILSYLHPEIVADTNKVYGTVKATLYHYTKTTISKGIVSFRIIDAKTGALLSVQKMPGEFVWKSEWATFNGDERALSAEQLRLTKQKELPAPAAQDLFIEFTRPIYDQITTKLKDFYKGY